MQNFKHMGDLGALKEKLENREIIGTLAEKHGAKAELLGTGSRTVLQYLFGPYPETWNDFVAAKQAHDFERDIRATFSGTGNLPSKHLEMIDKIYPVLLKSVPLTDSYNESVYGHLAKIAGCTPEETKDVIKALSLYTDEAIQQAIMKFRLKLFKE